MTTFILVQLDSDFLGRPRAVFANNQSNSKPSDILELNRVELSYPETKLDGAGYQKKTCEPLKDVVVFGNPQRLRRAPQAMMTILIREKFAFDQDLVVPVVCRKVIPNYCDDFP